MFKEILVECTICLFFDLIEKLSSKHCWNVGVKH